MSAVEPGERAAREEITELLARYGAHLDRQDHEGWLALFTEDARFFVYGRSFDGHEGLRRMAEAAPAGLHLGGLPVITVAGDRAEVQQSFLFVDQRTGGQRIGFYDDVVVRGDGTWRFESRRSTFLTPEGPSERP